MPEASAFVSLATDLRRAETSRARPEAPAAANVPADVRRERRDVDACVADARLVAHELALLRLAAHEAFARACDALLERFAHDVLARELALAPCDLAALAARIRAESGSGAVVLRVAPAVAAALDVPFPVHADAALGPNDVIVDVRDGCIDARFDLRASGALLAAREAAPEEAGLDDAVRRERA